MTTIYVSHGLNEYAGGTITELTGKDITGATFQVALGASSTIPPTTGWVSPDRSLIGPGTTLPNGTVIPPSAQRILELDISPTTPVGNYYLWAKIADNPEVAARVFPARITVA